MSHPHDFPPLVLVVLGGILTLLALFLAIDYWLLLRYVKRLEKLREGRS